MRVFWESLGLTRPKAAIHNRQHRVDCGPRAVAALINTDDMPHQFIVENAELKIGYLSKGQAGTVFPKKAGLNFCRDTFLPAVESLKGVLDTSN
jgi:hypothetical protein